MWTLRGNLIQFLSNLVGDQKHGENFVQKPRRHCALSACFPGAAPSPRCSPSPSRREPQCSAPCLRCSLHKDALQARMSGSLSVYFTSQTVPIAGCVQQTALDEYAQDSSPAGKSLRQEQEVKGTGGEAGDGKTFLSDGPRGTGRVPAHECSSPRSLVSTEVTVLFL